MFHLCGLACVYAAWLFMRPLVPCSVPGKSSKIAKTLEKAPHSWKCLHYVLALEYLLAENSKIHKRDLNLTKYFAFEVCSFLKHPNNLTREQVIEAATRSVYFWG